jgi:hypothetical protein
MAVDSKKPANAKAKEKISAAEALFPHLKKAEDERRANSAKSAKTRKPPTNQFFPGRKPQ